MPKKIKPGSIVKVKSWNELEKTKNNYDSSVGELLKSHFCEKIFTIESISEFVGEYKLKLKGIHDFYLLEDEVILINTVDLSIDESLFEL